MVNKTIKELEAELAYYKRQQLAMTGDPEDYTKIINRLTAEIGYRKLRNYSKLKFEEREIRGIGWMLCGFVTLYSIAGWKACGVAASALTIFNGWSTFNAKE